MTWECDQCGREFEKQFSLEQHQEGSGGCSSANVGHECECGQEFETFGDFLQHCDFTGHNSDLG